MFGRRRIQLKSDAELAASARAEAERQRQAEAAQQALQARHPDAADLAGGPTGPTPLREDRPAPSRTPEAAPATAARTAPAAAAADARYLLQRRCEQTGRFLSLDPE